MRNTTNPPKPGVINSYWKEIPALLAGTADFHYDQRE